MGNVGKLCEYEEKSISPEGSCCLTLGAVGVYGYCNVGKLCEWEEKAISPEGSCCLTLGAVGVVRVL